MYDTLIDGAALAAAEARHLAVRRRLETAQEQLDTAQRERGAAAEAHDVALGDGGDTKATAKRLRDADAALTLAAQTVPAVEGAIRRSETTLRGEVAAAHRPMRDRAVADLLAVAHRIDGLRHDLAGAIADYNGAAAALDVAQSRNLTAPNVGQIPPAATEALRRLPGLPDGDAHAHLVKVCKAHHPEIAALVEGAAQ